MSFRARAPVRIDFAGGWSDVPEFADTEGGAVVNAAIALYVHVECRVGGGSYRLFAEDVDERVFLPSPADVVYDGTLDLHKAALNMLPVPGGVEIISSSDVPPGSGLGGSGALDVALLQGLAACRGESYDAAELAEMGFLLETSELKLAGGRQDQYAAALGGFHEFSFGAGAGVEARSLDITAEAATAFSRHVAVVYTGQSHFSSQTHERVWQAYREDGAGVADAIRVMRDLVTPVAQSLEAGLWSEVGRLMDENWTQQQRLDATISTDASNDIESAVRAAGAWGLKATGAGAGGCLVIVGPSDRQADIATAATAGGGRVLEWSFALEGAKSWQVEEDAGHHDE